MQRPADVKAATLSVLLMTSSVLNVGHIPDRKPGYRSLVATDHLACHRPRKVLGLSFPHLYLQPPPCRSTTLSGTPLRSVVNHQPLALAIDIVYFKVSDDSDIEGHPNVDHKSLVRYSLLSTSHLTLSLLRPPSRPLQMETTPNSRRSGGEEKQNRYAQG